MDKKNRPKRILFIRNSPEIQWYRYVEGKRRGKNIPHKH